MKIVRWLMSILALIIAIIPLLFAYVLLEEPNKSFASGAMLISGVSGIVFAFIVNPLLSAKVTLLRSAKFVWTGAIIAIFTGVAGLFIGISGFDEAGIADYQQKLATYAKSHDGILIKASDYEYYELCLYGGDNTRFFREAIIKDGTSDYEKDIIPYIAWFVESSKSSTDPAYRHREAAVSESLRDCAAKKTK